MKSSFFKKNRERFISNMENNSIAIFFERDENVRRDSEYFNFTDTNFFYLTGVFQTLSKLIIYKKNNSNFEEIFFTKKPNKEFEKWIGKYYTSNEIKKISGIKNVRYLDDFEVIISKLTKKSKNVYFVKDSRDESKSISEYQTYEKKFNRKYKLKKLNSYDILKELRAIKSKEEIEEIRKAMKITEKAFKEIISNSKKYKSENEMEAVLTYNFIKNNCRHSYHPIVASGKNACTLHYVKNNMKLNNRDLILIDSGAEFNNYKTDITRTFPKNGKFTKKQRELYEAVLDIQKYAIKLIKPGLNKIEWERKIIYYVANKLDEINLLSKKKFEKKKELIRNFYPHSTGHYLGLDTHDYGDYSKSFREGEVYTVEPGIYIDKEGIGIRIEDNILVTKNGCEVLSKNIPKTVSQIERLATNRI